MQGVRCALELSHRHAVVVDFAITITILWVYSWSPELGNLKPHNDHSYSFFSIERLEVKFLFECILDFRQSRSTRFKTITYPQLMVLQKVKLEELRVVQETHNPQPGTTNSIWICHLQCCARLFQDANVFWLVHGRPAWYADHPKATVRSSSWCLEDWT